MFRFAHHNERKSSFLDSLDAISYMPFILSAAKTLFMSGPASASLHGNQLSSHSITITGFSIRSGQLTKRPTCSAFVPVRTAAAEQARDSAREMF